jgi:ATP-dependent DNA helicase DinG
MAKKVMEALAKEHQVMIEAGTGTGKTFAYLVPALLSGKKVVLSTGTRHLQDQIYFKDLPVLREIFPRPFSALLMKGKENYLCKHRYAGFSSSPLLYKREETLYLDQIMAWARQTEKGDKAELTGIPEDLQVWKEMSVAGNQCLGKTCSDYDDCFITRMKKEAEKAELIIVNHHLFFADLALKENSYGQILPAYDAVIFDEAHLIEEIASDYLGKSLSLYDLMEWMADARRELKGLQIKDKAIWDSVESLYKRGELFFNLFRMPSADPTFRSVDQSVQRLDGSGDPNTGKRFRLFSVSTCEPGDPKTGERSSSNPEAVISFLNLLERLGGAFQTLPDRNEGCFKIAERAEQLRENALLFIKQEDLSLVYWGESARGQEGLVLHANPLDVSERLRESLFSRPGTMVLTSATMTVDKRFDYMKKKLGVSPTEEFQFESPFDYASNALIYLPKHLPDPSSDLFLEAAGKEILEILRLTEGRAFVLCTSHKNKTYFYDYCQDKLDYLLLKQGDGPKTELLREFRKEQSSVLFATRSFWQGVDVQGEALSCVIVDKLPFASPGDPLVESRIEQLRKLNVNPFMEYQVPSAIILLKQGLGRLIRSAEDRGVLSILDPRIRSKSYGKRFLASLPPCRMTSARQDIKEFLVLSRKRKVNC